MTGRIDCSVIVACGKPLGAAIVGYKISKESAKSIDCCFIMSDRKRGIKDAFRYSHVALVQIPQNSDSRCAAANAARSRSGSDHRWNWLLLRDCFDRRTAICLSGHVAAVIHSEFRRRTFAAIVIPAFTALSYANFLIFVGSPRSRFSRRIAAI
jgi:hypothetical protein